jgi:hypothetical protein
MSRRLGEYVPLSTTYADDDAILGLSPFAELLFLRSNALAGQLNSDGYLTEAQVIYRAARKLGSEKKVRTLAKELVDAGVWAQQDGGYTIRAWLKWNKSAEELGRERARDRDRKRAERGGNASGDGDDPGSVQADTGRTPAGQGPDSAGNPGGLQEDSEGSPASRTPAREGARRAVVTAVGNGTALHGTARDGTNGSGARPASMLGVSLLDEHLGALPARPPREVITELSTRIEAQLGQGATDKELTEALSRMRLKNLGFHLLASLVNEVRQEWAGGGNGRASPATGRREQVEEARRNRALQRAQQREEATT